MLKLRESAMTRVTVRVLIMLFLVFGATFVPARMTVKEGSGDIETVMLTGNEATRFLAARTGRDTRLAAAMEKVRRKPGVQLAGQVVHLTRRAQEGRLSLLQLLFGGTALHAEDVTYYADEAVVVYTPYESDSNNDTAEFSVWVQDYDTGATRTGDVVVWTYEAAYGNPDAAVDVLDVSVECAPAPAVSLLSWFAPSLHAQNSHGGASCSDEEAQKLRGRQDVKNAVKEGLKAAGSAVIFCIGAAHGWIVCVGIAFVSGASAHISWDTAAYVWNCRCKLFGWDCDSSAPPI